MTNLENLQRMDKYEFAKILFGCEFCVYYKTTDKGKNCTVFNDNSKTCADGRIKWLESECEE